RHPRLGFARCHRCTGYTHQVGNYRWGPVACEAATWMAALGSKVTMLVREGTLLTGLEPFAADILAEQLEYVGVDIQFFTEAAEVRRPDGLDLGLGKVKG